MVIRELGSQHPKTVTGCFWEEKKVKSSLILFRNSHQNSLSIFQVVNNVSVLCVFLRKLYMLEWVSVNFQWKRMRRRGNQAIVCCLWPLIR